MIAIIALSRDSRRLGAKLHRQLQESRLLEMGTDFEKGGLHALVADCWQHCRSIIFIMATGIAVRSCAPLIKNKTSDPAVLVIDDHGNHVIPLLSGHLGGANRLARRVAGILDAVPVITTASDLQGAVSFDDLAGANGWVIERLSDLTSVTQSVLDKKTVYLYSGLPVEIPLPGTIIPRQTEDLALESAKAGHNPAVVISEKSGITQMCKHGSYIILRPRNIVAGIGCRRGTPARVIVDTVTGVLESLRISVHSLSALATIPLKKDEQGLLEASETLGIPVKWIDTDDIKSCPEAIEKTSGFVEEITGVAAVSEPAARLACKRPRMLLIKYKKNGITLSIAQDLSVAVSMPPEPGIKPRLNVVGIGPGGRERLSIEALQVLQSCNVIIGYRTYTRLLNRMMDTRHARVESSGMTDEIERCRQAVSEVRAGNNVALISGGDPGVYGMAGPLLQLLAEEDVRVDVRIFPGITAATAAASRLGAPLTHDFSVISLSDRLTPWPLIEKRINAAASSDMVMVFYNPRSKGRPGHLQRALEIAGTRRRGDTPVGIVTDGGRVRETVIRTTLDAVNTEDVSMSSTVIIGNSRTRFQDDWMITPRGYSL